MATAHMPEQTAPAPSTSRMVVLLTASLLLSAFVAFALPRVSGVSLVSLAAVVPLATLVLAGRHSMRQQTLTVLSWAMGGAAVTFVPTVVYSVVVLTLIQGMTPIVEAPLWGSTSWSISPDLLIALAIGAVAGLRWPDRLLMPRYRFETSSWPLRVLINIVAIVLVEFLVGLVVVFPIVWSINYWSYWDQPPFSTLTAAEIPVLDILKLAVVAIVLVIAAKSRGIAVETQRVLLWGVIGMVIWFVAAVILQAVLSWAAMSLTRDISEYYAFGLIPVTQGLVEGRPQSVVVLSWMGLTIGVWAGLGWPGGLMVPRWLSGDARTSGDLLGLRHGRLLGRVVCSDGPRGSRPGLVVVMGLGHHVLRPVEGPHPRIFAALWATRSHLPRSSFVCDERLA